jgi:hypothetical protein
VTQDPKPRSVVVLHNCSVVAWEPVHQFRALLSFNLAANKVAHLVTVREGLVADNPGGTQVCALLCICVSVGCTEQCRLESQ